MTKAVGVPLDLSSLDEAVKRQDDGIDVDVVGLDGKTAIGLKIRVAGPDSVRAQKAQEELADELLEQEHAGRVKAGEATKRGIRYLAKLTIGWAPAVTLDGKEMAYSVANAEKLYGRFKFIRDQVDRAAGDRARFTKG